MPLSIYFGERMKKEVKSKCSYKNICKDYKYYDRVYPLMSGYGTDYCNANDKKTESCITGDENTIRALCSDYNKNGQCKKFAPLPHAELKRIINNYTIKIMEDDPFFRDTPAKILANDLLRLLEGRESHILESINYGTDPYESKVIVTKKAILKSLEYRGFKLEEQKTGTLYGDDKKIKPNDYLKEKSWLERVKKALGK